MPNEDFSSIFSFDEDLVGPAKIRVIGVGGGGGNAVNNMINKGIEEIEFVAINTDAQALENNKATHKIQIGRHKTKGLGAGARAGVGAEAATESQVEIEQVLEGCDMVFITAGLGGGTGTGAAPVVAAIAKRLGILTVAIVTKPFSFEGPRRMKAAKEGGRLLRENVDTLIVIPNDRLLEISDSQTTVAEAFERADSVLYNATRGISDLITMHGHINLDFADIKTTMIDGGTAIMSSAVASGENRAERAAIEALNSPLLEGQSIFGARNVLVNITAGESPGIQESMRATEIIQNQAGDEAELIWGVVVDKSMGDELRVTVIATGFQPEEEEVSAPKPARATLEPTKVPHYKGEKNLRQLDIPAYARRSSDPMPEPAQPVNHAEFDDVPSRYDTHSSGYEQSRTRSRTGGSVRLVTARDLDMGSERIRKDDSDTPAFLRKMMD